MTARKSLRILCAPQQCIAETHTESWLRSARPSCKLSSQLSLSSCEHIVAMDSKQYEKQCKRGESVPYTRQLLRDLGRVPPSASSTQEFIVQVWFGPAFFPLSANHERIRCRADSSDPYTPSRCRHSSWASEPMH